ITYKNGLSLLEKLNLNNNNWLYIYYKSKLNDINNNNNNNNNNDNTKSNNENNNNIINIIVNNSIDFKVIKARNYQLLNLHNESYNITKEILTISPFNKEVLDIHIGNLVELGK